MIFFFDIILGIQIVFCFWLPTKIHKEYSKEVNRIIYRSQILRINLPYSF